jgi:hypothetical protein
VYRQSTNANILQVNKAVKDLTDKIRAFLEDKETKTPLPRGYSGRVTGAYKSMLAQRADGEELLSEYHAAFYTRHVTLKRLRKRLQMSVLDDTTKEIKSMLQDAKKASTGGLHTTGKGGAPRQLYKKSKKVDKAPKSYTATRL